MIKISKMIKISTKIKIHFHRQTMVIKDNNKMSKLWQTIYLTVGKN